MLPIVNEDFRHVGNLSEDRGPELIPAIVRGYRIRRKWENRIPMESIEAVQRPSHYLSMSENDRPGARGQRSESFSLASAWMNRADRSTGLVDESGVVICQHYVRISENLSHLPEFVVLPD